ncbi:MAG: HAD-IIIC family phosphatase [Pseudomonadota bacterium]
MLNATVDEALSKAEFQRTIFSERPRRADLLRIAAAMSVNTKAFRLRVHRNHPFEFIASALPPFLSYSDRRVECVLGDYDDSLTLAIGGDADIELVWLDFDRYKLDANELLDWLFGRIEALRAKSRAPILVAASSKQDTTACDFNRQLRERSTNMAGVRVLPLDEIAASLGPDYHDARMSQVGATRLSERANIEIARHMGLCWLPAALAPRLKAVVFDLDNTLWKGVLGEDGIEGIVIDEKFKALHAKAAALADSGLFIGLLSRNEPADVDAMLASGRMGHLAEKISARSISWNSKADGMKHIADTLRIGYDAILFVDDNPGELAAIAAACPGIHLLFASPDPAETTRALDFYPGLFTWGSDSTDALRANDLATNDARDALRAEAGSERDYLESLKLVLRIAANPHNHRTRLQQLSQKTNQFNLALRRLSEIDVDEALNDPRQAAVGIWLNDRFSDSGLIGALFARLEEENRLRVEELCVSCRALGRGIEDAMIIAALNAAIDAIEHATNTRILEIGFAYDQGPRNEPARSWLRKFSGQGLGERGFAILPWNAEERAATVRNLPIRIKQGAPDAI